MVTRGRKEAMSWTDLSDSEVEARLIQRGMPPIDARSWVYYRESIGGKAQIDRFLEDEVKEDDVDE